MDSYATAFADLLVDQDDRRIDEKPGIRRPTLGVIENHLKSEAAANPALVGWHTFRPGDDTQADAIEGMCRGQSHRRNMATRGPPAASLVTSTPLTRPQPLTQRPNQPVKLRVTAEEKPRARRTAEQPPQVAKPAIKPITRPTPPLPRPTPLQSNGGGLMASKWAPQASGAGNGLATSVTGWNNPNPQPIPSHRPQAQVAPTVVKVNRMDATAPTVFRERPKRPPSSFVHPEPSVVPSANMSRPVVATVAPVKAAPAPVAPAPIAPSSVPKAVGIIEIRCAGSGNDSFYVDRFMAEAALEMLKANAIKKEDLKADKEVWRVNGGI